MEELIDDQLRVVIIGTGYVGLTTGVCLAYLGHKVTCVDSNPEIVVRLNRGEATIHEAGIQELLVELNGSIRFTTSLSEALPRAEIVIIAVGTPPKRNGDADVSAVEIVAREIGDVLQEELCPVIVNKSTVPIGSARRVKAVIQDRLTRRGLQRQVFVASNPEFLREGAAISDTLYPDRIVVGADEEEAVNVLRKLYLPILKQTFECMPTIPIRPHGYELPEFVTTTTTSAELIKYAGNCFLATKISFINEFAGLAERVGADIQEVACGIGLDKRIGPRFLNAGLGWGGSCFGKDTKAILYTASQYGYPMQLIGATVDSNYRHRLTVVEKLQLALKVIRGCTIGILGLSFKPNTDDLRDAPAIDIIDKLIELGARVKVYDPIAMDNFKHLFPDLDVEYTNNISELSNGCDALVLVTEWPHFAAINWRKIGKLMNRKIFIDGRNMFDRRAVETCGFIYQGIGR